MFTIECVLIFLSMLFSVSFQTPDSHKVNQRTNNTSTSFVQRTTTSIMTQNSSYEVGESSSRTKRSKRPSLQPPTPVRFNLNDDDRNVRKVYDKYVGISEGIYIYIYRVRF